MLTAPLPVDTPPVRGGPSFQGRGTFPWACRRVRAEPGQDQEGRGAASIVCGISFCTRVTLGNRAMVSLRTGVGLYQGSILGCRETLFCEGVTSAVLSAVRSLDFGGRGCTYTGHCSLPGPAGPRLCQVLLCIWGIVRSKHPRTLSSPTGSREVLIVQVSGLFSLLGWECTLLLVDSGTAGVACPQRAWGAAPEHPGAQPQSQGPRRVRRELDGQAVCRLQEGRSVGQGGTGRLCSPTPRAAAGRGAAHWRLELTAI